MSRSPAARVVAVVAMLAAGHIAQTGAQSDLTPAFLAHQRTVVERWMEDTGLAKQFEVIRLRASEHPDPEAAGRRGYRLELRFLTQGSQDAARTAFQRFLDAQLAATGQPFTASCFYRVVHLLGVGRELVSVHYYVLETEYAVYLETATRELVVREISNRGVRRSMAGPAPGTAAPARGPATSVPRTNTAGDIRQAIQKLLEDYFRGAVKPGQPAPTLDWRSFEPDYLELGVSGLRGQVIGSRNYWEKLKLSLVIKTDEKEWKLDWFVDGLYAAGLGSNRPADDSYYLMEKDYLPQLEAYADRLLSAVHRSLTAGR